MLCKNTGRKTKIKRTMKKKRTRKERGKIGGRRERGH